MVISHKYRFIFIKTRKTAGTSFEVFFSRFAGERDVLTPVYPPEPGHVARNHRGLWNPLPDLLEGGWRQGRHVLRQWRRRRKFYNHMPARTVRRRVPRSVWDGYFKFCVERNPWDKTLSYYHMLNQRSGGTLTLDDYFAAGDVGSDFDAYADSRGRLLVDRVLRFESLNDELGEICAMLGVPWAGTLAVKAKGKIRTDRRSWQEVLTARQQVLVANAFAREIARFSYRADG